MNEQMGSISIKTPEFVSIEFQPAGLGSRAVSFIIDQLVIVILNIILFFLLYLTMGSIEDFFFRFSSPLFPIAVVVILTFVINTGYFFILEYFTGGRTIGKKMMGIRVIQENGHSITLLSSFIRNFIRIIDSLPAGYFIGIIMIFTHSQHKRLGDLVAGTIVVHERGKAKKTADKTLQTELKKRMIRKDTLQLTDWTLQSFTSQEWKLLKAYSERFTQMDDYERAAITKKLSEILLTKAGLMWEEKTVLELENMLLSLYLNLKDHWEYEL